MGKKKFKRFKKGNEKTEERKERTDDYVNIIKKNEDFENYYKTQKIVPAEEWDDFMKTVVQTLPASFRIASNCPGQANVLRNIVESEQFKDLISENPNESSLKCLTWYPDRLAWQFSCSRVEIKQSDSLRKLQNFLIAETESGYISRQEAVSMIPPLLLDVKPHHRVLDMCAAPGSKTAQIIEMLQPDECSSVAKGVVVANDVDNKRCYMLVHQTKRLHSPCCIITNHEAGTMPSFYETNDSGERVEVKFDRILCDVPCSGDGTIRKNYDVWRKWNVANGNNFNGIQFRIIKRGLELLKNGGRLVYSTCSFNPIEDEAIISNIIALTDGGVELVDVSSELNGLKYSQGLSDWVVMTREMNIVNDPNEVEEKYKTQIRPILFPPKNAVQFNLNRCIRIIPHHQDTGGFFVAVLEKKVDVLQWEKDNSLDKNRKRINDQDDSRKDSNYRSDKKRIKYRCHTEDPFIFFDEKSQDWPLIKNYYNINDSFPYEQLAHRCTVGNKRNIYFLTESAKKIITENPDIKFINAGVRIFSRSHDKLNPCGFRLSQEGLLSLFTFLKQESLVDINQEEITKILSNELVPMDEFKTETREKFTKINSGSCILVYEQVKENNNLLLPICAWKGVTSMKAYIAKNEKIHLLRVCGANVDHIEPYRKD